MSDRRSRRRGHRRLSAVARDPQVATLDDIELLLRTHGVPEERAWDVWDRASDADLDASLLWRWAMAFDGVELAHLLGSELSHRDLVVMLTDSLAMHDSIVAAVS